MAIVKFNCNSGANIHSNRSETIDTVRDLDMAEGEWESLSEDERYKIVEQWAWERLEIHWSDAE